MKKHNQTYFLSTRRECPVTNKCKYFFNFLVPPWLVLTRRLETSGTKVEDLNKTLTWNVWRIYEWMPLGQKLCFNWCYRWELKIFKYMFITFFWVSRLKPLDPLHQLFISRKLNNILKRMWQYSGYAVISVSLSDIWVEVGLQWVACHVKLWGWSTHSADLPQDFWTIWSL